MWYDDGYGRYTKDDSYGRQLSVFVSSSDYWFYYSGANHIELDKIYNDHQIKVKSARDKERNKGKEDMSSGL